MEKESMRHYDAFISYRHTPLDMFVAKTIQKKLEEFKLPKNVKRKQAHWERKKIERVFRDQDELPITSDLSDQIYTALTSSDYLIVICSPRIKESLWCQQEIKTFIELRGYDHVLAVLAEGEPMESFPDEIVYRQEYCTDEYGNTALQTVPVEPLAADVRGKNRREIKKKIDEEITRLVAPMFSVDYDDLKQRHKERKLKKTLSIAGGIAAAFAVFGIVSSFMALRIIKQNNKIEAQSIALQTQNSEIKEQSDEIGKQQEQLQEQYNNIAKRVAKDYGSTAVDYLEGGDYENAIKYAHMSVTADEDGNELPVTPAGMNALIRSTYAYQVGAYCTPCMTIQLENELVAELISPERNYILFEDEYGIVKIYDLHTMHLIKQIDCNETGYVSRRENIASNTLQFLDDDTIVYQTKTYFAVYNFVKDEMYYSFSFTHNGYYRASLNYVIPSYQKKRAIFVCGGDTYLYDYKTKTVECIISDKDSSIDFQVGSKPQLTDDEEYLCFTCKDYETNETRFIEYHIDERKAVHELRFAKDEMDNFRAYRFDGDRVYIYADFMELTFDEYSPNMVRCYDCNTSKVIWETVLTEKKYGNLTTLITDTGETNDLVLLDTDVLVSFDKNTGKLQDYEQCDGDILSYEYKMFTESNAIRILTSNGNSSMFYYDDRLIVLNQRVFTKDLDFFEVAAGHYFTTKDDYTKIYVWGTHRGQRVTAQNCELEGYGAVVSSDEKYVFSHNSSGIYMQDIDSSEIIWSTDLSVNDIYYFPCGRILAVGYSSFYIYDAMTGKEIYKNESDSFVYLINMNIEEGYVLYTRSRLDYVMKIDISSGEEKEFIELVDSEGNQYGHDLKVSEDGSAIAYYSFNDQCYYILHDGVRIAKISLNSDNIRDIFFVPGYSYLLFEYTNSTISFYDYTVGEFVSSMKNTYGTIEFLEQGNKDLPIIIHTNIDNVLFFTEQMEFIGMDYSIIMKRIPGTQDCFITSNHKLYTVPLYTVDMLKEDATKILSGEVNLDIE